MSKGHHSADENSRRHGRKSHRKNKSSGSQSNNNSDIDLFEDSSSSKSPRWAFPDEALQNALILLNLVLAASWLILYTFIFLDRSGYISLQQMSFLGGMHSPPKPKLCIDGITYGYSDWSSLRSAIQAISQSNQNESSPDPFVICPQATLTGSKRDTSPIFINVPDVTIECGHDGIGSGCIVERGGSHLSFGSNARGIVIRGITFRGAGTTSQVFYYDNAEVVYEDCNWDANSALRNVGAVVDINSVSTVYFNRCDVSEAKQIPRVRVGFGGGFGSSISIRK